MPRQVDHAQRRELIAAALMRVAAARGLEAVSLRHVAAEAGVTAGMVQHYFSSKDSMLDFAMRSAAARYQARIDEALGRLDSDASPRAVVGVLLQALLPVDEQQREDGRVGLAFQSLAATRRATGQGPVEADTGLLDFVAQQVRTAQSQRQDVAAVDALVLATALVGAAEGLATLVLSAGLDAEGAVAALGCVLDLALAPSPPAGTDR